MLPCGCKWHVVLLAATARRLRKRTAGSCTELPPLTEVGAPYSFPLGPQHLQQLRVQPLGQLRLRGLARPAVHLRGGAGPQGGAAGGAKRDAANRRAVRQAEHAGGARGLRRKGAPWQGRQVAWLLFSGWGTSGHAVGAGAPAGPLPVEAWERHGASGRGAADVLRTLSLAGDC